MNNMDQPNYNPEQVQPMRDELVAVGFKELLTSEDVDRVISESKSNDKTYFFMLNSVCGCAGGNARPGVNSALQNDVIPDKLYTVFAGMEKAATRQLREYLEPNIPSSPSMALFKGGELVQMMHRHDIENATASQVTGALVTMFREHCEAQGPSIPREEFDKLVHEKICGSTLEPYSV